MEANSLLDTYFKQLRLPTCLQNYHKSAEEAAHSDHGYYRFLLALAEQEVAQRERNRIARCIKGPRVTALKELADFDFSCISSPSKQRVLELSRGSYIHKAAPVILVGNPGLRKTHVAIGLALAACRQGRKVRFHNAAGLVNDLISAQEELEPATFWSPTTRAPDLRPRRCLANEMASSTSSGPSHRLDRTSRAR
jgi:DNA replication protein DnaC